MAARHGILTALLLAASVALPHGASSARVVAADAPSALAGTNDLSARGAAGASVVIPRRARLSALGFVNPDVLIRSRNAVAALALVKEPVGENAPQWVAMQWPWCSLDGCSARDRTVVLTANWPAGEMAGDDVVLEPGRYRIYLMSSRPKTTASLRLHGLQGSSSIPLGQPVFAATGSRTHDGLDGGAAEARVARDTQVLPAPGIQLFAATVETGEGNHGAYGLTHCVTRLTPQVPEDPNDSPASCGFDGGVDRDGLQVRDEMWALSPLSAGPYAAAATFKRVSSVAPPTPVEFMWAWLAYE